jgi:HPt (histidine-containing phosphotransfer) domain-containing protein
MGQDRQQSKPKIMVQLDPDIRDLIPGFLENRRKDVQTLRGALAKDDFKAIVVLGHTMKGDGGGYGFDTITDIGALIETAAKQQSREQVRQAVERLADFLERVEVVYQ